LNIGELRTKAHENAKERGFWENPRAVGTMIALLHSELSEALEADRKGDSGQVAEELADCAIRFFDMSAGLKIWVPQDKKTVTEIMLESDFGNAEKMEFGEMVSVMHMVLSAAFKHYVSGQEDRFDEALIFFFLVLCGYCAYLDIDLEEAIVKKMFFNKSRSKLHGKRY